MPSQPFPQLTMPMVSTPAWCWPIVAPQPGERSIRSERQREEQRKARRDVVLREAAHILSDEIDLIRNNTKLAARLLLAARDGCG